MSAWLHAACSDCFESHVGGQRPADPIASHPEVPCCFCFRYTVSGLYLRRDPLDTPCAAATLPTHEDD